MEACDAVPIPQWCMHCAVPCKQTASLLFAERECSGAGRRFCDARLRERTPNPGNDVLEENP